MKEVFLLSKEEKREIESIADIILSVTDSFETFTSDEFDGEENEDKAVNVDELRDRMKYDMNQLEKSHDILSKILSGTYEGNPSVRGYELGK